ncbi:hypothetical protein PhaeoP48_02705 [Phaeobacter inhibens]|nr:hypothetical protein PhaeoP48_02705 [Phaeobacter inhibens]
MTAELLGGWVRRTKRCQNPAIWGGWSDAARHHGRAGAWFEPQHHFTAPEVMPRMSWREKIT